VQGLRQSAANFCKHRLAYGLAKRATAQMAEAMQALDEDKDEGGRLKDEKGTPELPVQPSAYRLPPLPEAPASANVHVKIGGRMVQITLRDADEDRLMVRMARMMARYPVDEPPPPQETPEGWCAVYATQMYWNEPKDGQGRGWWSHKAEDGTWCKGKPRKR
jgi:hypothetical protein